LIINLKTAKVLPRRSARRQDLQGGILNAAVPNAASSREFCDRSDFEFFKT
jgi:hypothetical protein